MSPATHPSTRRAAVPVAELARLALIPAPGRPVPDASAPDGRHGVRVAARTDGDLAGGTPRNELPEALVAGAVRGDGRARDELLALALSEEIAGGGAHRRGRSSLVR